MCPMRRKVPYLAHFGLTSLYVMFSAGSDPTGYASFMHTINGPLFPFIHWLWISRCYLSTPRQVSISQALDKIHTHIATGQPGIYVYPHDFFLVKVKVTLVQALRLCTGRTAHRGSRGIAIPFHYHGTRRGWGVNVTLRPLFTPGKYPAPIVQEAGCAPGPVWTGAENLAPSGILSPDRPARSQSLYRLS